MPTRIINAVEEAVSLCEDYDFYEAVGRVCTDYGLEEDECKVVADMVAEELGLN